MGKGDLWDDSVLINAFDDAIKKYKVMHSNGYNNCSSEEGSIRSNTEESDSTAYGVNEKAEGGCKNEGGERAEDVEKNDNFDDASSTAREIGETNNRSVAVEDKKVDTILPDNIVGPLQDAQLNVPESYLNSEQVEDYNTFLNKYYELEEQRQEVLQQLYQFGSWNYNSSTEGPGSYLQWATHSTSQEHQAPVHTSEPAFAYSYCQCSCQCSSAPRDSAPVVCGVKACIDSTATTVAKSSPSVGNDFTRIAMGAAEKAISSMGKRTNESCIIEGKERGEQKTEDMEQSANPETDLAELMNAWYTAGFYTGKYLTEQAIAKKQQG